VSRPGGQGGGRWPRGTKPLEQQSPGARPQRSGRLSPRGSIILVWSRRWGHYLGCPEEGLVPESGLALWVSKSLGGQSRFSRGLDYLTWDGRDPGVSKTAKARPRGKAPKWGSLEGAKACGDQQRSNPSWSKPCKGRKWFPKPWWVRHKVESPGGRAPGIEAQGARPQRSKRPGEQPWL
jgi:hypothetical protein